jgi:hypothetical protein
MTPSRFLESKKRTLVLSIMLCSAILTTLSSQANAWPWSGSAAEQSMKKQASNGYKQLTSDCFDISGYSKIKAVGQPRSTERLAAINKFAVPLVQKLCLKDSRASAFENPYFGIDLGKLNEATYPSNEYNLLQTILYNLDFGFTPFTPAGTICGDGSLSPSAGQGTCSWHGGYAKARGNGFSFNAYQEFEAPNGDKTSALSSLGLHRKNFVAWDGMQSPIPNITTGAKGFNCVTSSGFKPSCFHAPHFGFVFCGSQNTGKLQLLVGRDWTTGWSETGNKLAKNCPSDTPYLFEVNGTTVLSGNLRILFPDKSSILFKVAVGSS